jgi:integrase/recombinase XerD
VLIRDIIDCNPFDKIETSIKEPVMLPKTIPLDTIGEILCFAYTQIEKSNTEYKKNSAIRNAAVLELLFATGACSADVFLTVKLSIILMKTACRKCTML